MRSVHPSCVTKDVAVDIANTSAKDKRLPWLDVHKHKAGFILMKANFMKVYLEHGDMGRVLLHFRKQS